MYALVPPMLCRLVSPRFARSGLVYIYAARSVVQNRLGGLGLWIGPTISFKADMAMQWAENEVN